VAGRVADAVVAGGAWPGRGPAVTVVDATGKGVNNADADADARPGVALPVGITASVGVTTTVGVTASVKVTTATAVTNARAATRADAAEARDATPSSWPGAASGKAATGSVATERRGVYGGIRGELPAVVVAADGVCPQVEAAGDRGGV